MWICLTTEPRTWYRTVFHAFFLFFFEVYGRRISFEEANLSNTTGCQNVCISLPCSELFFLFLPDLFFLSIPVHSIPSVFGLLPEGVWKQSKYVLPPSRRRENDPGHFPFQIFFLYVRGVDFGLGVSENSRHPLGKWILLRSSKQRYLQVN